MVRGAAICEQDVRVDAQSDEIPTGVRIRWHLPERHAEPHGETRSLSRASVKDMPPCLRECTGFPFFERLP